MIYAYSWGRTFENCILWRSYKKIIINIYIFTINVCNQSIFYNKSISFLVYKKILADFCKVWTWFGVTALPHSCRNSGNACGILTLPQKLLLISALLTLTYLVFVGGWYIISIRIIMCLFGIRRDLRGSIR